MNTVPVSGSSPAVPVAVGWWESLQNYFGKFLESLKLSKQELIQILTFFAIGFCVGFLFKKYVRYFFIITILFILLFIVFNYLGVVLINWSSVKQLTGLDSHMTIQQGVEQVALAIKDHLMLTISTLVGVMLGFRVG